LIEYGHAHNAYTLLVYVPEYIYAVGAWGSPARPCICRELFKMLADQCSCVRKAIEEARPDAANESGVDEEEEEEEEEEGEHCIGTDSHGTAVQMLHSESYQTLGEPTVHLAMVMALAHARMGVWAPARTRALLAGTPHTLHAPEQVALNGFQIAAANIYADDLKDSRRLANVIAPVMAGKIDVDVAARLPILFAEHVRKQPLHASVPLITAEEVLSLQHRPGISELIAIDCRMSEEYDVRLLIIVHSCWIQSWKSCLSFASICFLVF
jgi:hypothetical protein